MERELPDQKERVFDYAKVQSKLMQASPRGSVDTKNLIKCGYVIQKHLELLINFFSYSDIKLVHKLIEEKSQEIEHM